MRQQNGVKDTLVSRSFPKGVPIPCAVSNLFYLADRPHATPTKPNKLTLSNPIPAARYSVGPLSWSRAWQCHYAVESTWGSGITQPPVRLGGVAFVFPPPVNVSPGVILGVLTRH